jgi:aminoglycoside/choline kinase family phosphotransferase
MSDAELEAQLEDLAVRALGARPRAIQWLAAGLGQRRFARLVFAGGEVAAAIARIEAPEDPRIRPAGVLPEPAQEPIRALLEAHGLPVPRRYAAAPDAGIELLEDLGDLSLERAQDGATPDRRRSLYALACDLVPQLQRVRPAPGVAAFERRLSPELIAFKGELFAKYALPLRGRATSPAESAAVAGAFARIAELAASAPQRLSHRDLQSTNLLLRRSASGGEELALIDLQGAFLAPPEYDLVCLLRDSYVELGASELEEQLARVRPQLPDAPPRDEFELRFDALTLTRKGKDLARFLQAASERADRRYLRFVAPTQRMLSRAAPRAASAMPALAELAELIAEVSESVCAP